MPFGEFCVEQASNLGIRERPVIYTNFVDDASKWCPVFVRNHAFYWKWSFRGVIRTLIKQTRSSNFPVYEYPMLVTVSDIGVLAEPLPRRRSAKQIHLDLISGSMLEPRPCIVTV